LSITGTGFHLVHDSSDAPGYMSSLLIALTGQTVPRQLVIVRLRVVVEGVVFERDLEADVDLQYRFTWDRRNAYNQKVYGVVTAIGKPLRYEPHRACTLSTESFIVNGSDNKSKVIWKNTESLLVSIRQVAAAIYDCMF